MDELNAMGSLGLTMPSPAYLFGALLFGIIGIAAYRYGKKAELAAQKWIGIHCCPKQPKPSGWHLDLIRVLDGP